MLVKQLPSFCYSGRNRPIEGVAVHFISGKYVEPGNPWGIQVCWDLLHDLNLPRSGRKFYPDCDGIARAYASYSILIGRERGEHWLLVPIQKETYHAGISMHKGRSDCNKFMLGVALVADEKSGYTDWQYECLAETIVTLQGLPESHAVKFGLDDIVGHDRLRHNAKSAGLKNADGSEPKNKLDPSGQSDGLGQNFDWSRLLGIITDVRRTAGGGEVNQQ